MSKTRWSPPSWRHAVQWGVLVTRRPPSRGCAGIVWWRWWKSTRALLASPHWARRLSVTSGTENVAQLFLIHFLQGLCYVEGSHKSAGVEFYPPCVECAEKCLKKLLLVRPQSRALWLWPVCVFLVTKVEYLWKIKRERYKIAKYWKYCHSQKSRIKFKTKRKRQQQQIQNWFLLFLPNGKLKKMFQICTFVILRR